MSGRVENGSKFKINTEQSFQMFCRIDKQSEHALEYNRNWPRGHSSVFYLKLNTEKWNKTFHFFFLTKINPCHRLLTVGQCVFVYVGNKG